MITIPPIFALSEITSQPMFLAACVVATLAHTIMVMIMSNVSLAMEDSGFTLADTSFILELHFIAMFGPGLFLTGALMVWYGAFSVALAGALIFLVASLVLAMGDELWNYSLGMVLSGLGWNFAYSAGTVMLTNCYKPAEASKVQAVNDFTIYSTAGIGSLLSGIIFVQYKWLVLIYAVTMLTLIYLSLFGVIWWYAAASAVTATVTATVTSAGAAVDDYVHVQAEEKNKSGCRLAGAGSSEHGLYGTGCG